MRTGKSFGRWTPPKRALVTGASAGIGAAFARELASRGFDCVLLARRKDRLEEIARELEAAHKVRVEIITADLSESAQSREAAERVASMDVDLLVNNAGFGTHGLFADLPFEKIQRSVEVHVLASLRMARAVLPGMRRRGRGAIINVASLGAFVLTPGSVIYDATKAFLVTFSENLRLETGADGILVQALCPGFTLTEFHDVGDVGGFRREMVPDALWMRASDVARMSIGALRAGARTVFIPGWKNRLARWAVGHSAALRSFMERKAPPLTPSDPSC